MGVVFSICELLIYRKCNCIDVVDDMALYPPIPYYRVEDINGNLLLKYGVILMTQDLPPSMSVKFIPLDDTIHLCIVHFKSRSSKRVVIYSHGNAADIGCCIDYMEILGRELDCDFIFYDYEGYGNLPKDLRAVYNYARTLFPATSIYLAGESIGSVPTCAVASDLFLEQYRSCTPGATIEQPLAGVILHAGLHSGKTYPCGCLIQCCDPLNNAQRVSEIECPIFHIHGKLDVVVPFKWGRRLHDISHSEFEPWWVKDSGHSDIFANHPEEYVERWNNFFTFCENKLSLSSSSSSSSSPAPTIHTPEGATSKEESVALEHHEQGQLANLTSAITTIQPTENTPMLKMDVDTNAAVNPNVDVSAEQSED